MSDDVTLVEGAAGVTLNRKRDDVRVEQQVGHGGYFRPSLRHCSSASSNPSQSSAVKFDATGEVKVVSGPTPCSFASSSRVLPFQKACGSTLSSVDGLS